MTGSEPGHRQSTFLLVLVALIALSLGALAWSNWHQDQERDLGGIVDGGLWSVSLVNGQIYYGTLREAHAEYVKLSEVYYVQSVSLPNGQLDNRLVNRRKNDWHGPQSQVIMTNKILFMEAVGAESTVAKLIQRDKQAVEK